MTALPDVLEPAGPNEGLLLYRRMASLGLDIEAWTRCEPTMLAGFARICTSCRCPQRCAADLVAHADDPIWRDWRDYCPNAAKLNMLVALQLY